MRNEDSSNRFASSETCGAAILSSTKTVDSQRDIVDDLSGEAYDLTTLNDRM